VCQAIYRDQFLPENTIGVCAEQPSDNYSVKSIKWLKYVSQKDGINIRHACNGGEVTVGKYKVDGFCKETNTIYQFHGCYFHGCKKCYNELTVNKVSRYNMKYLNTRTASIDDYLRSQGFNLETIWEHDFDRSKEMKAVTLDEYDLVQPPKLREAFYGGRCEPIKLIQDFKNNNEKGKYIDVVSLYPTVMYYDRYPVGHPIKINKPKKL
jgi:G:T-mismatch repair DNA endonuclease (very short patch repair protein)